MELDSEPSTEHLSAVLTRTIVRTPVIRWILYARIRHQYYKDVVFVGEDFVQVKQIGLAGQLDHVASKTNFDAQIRAAKMFDNADDGEYEDFLVKLERDRKSPLVARFPPQYLVLTMDSNDLVFLYLQMDTRGTYSFVQQALPMPSFDRILFQPGEHLAVDPFSRALAVASNEREVIIYSAKPRKQIQHEMTVGSKNWCPISSQRPLQVDGVIQHIDFLIPASDDEDHVILLLIVTDRQRTKAIRIEWQHSSGPINADIHPGQALGPDRKIPNLLIPLRDAAFLLITGDVIGHWKGIPSGSATGIELMAPKEPPQYPGNSSRPPLWVNWAKPMRNQASRREKDTVYLVREDGLVYLYVIYIRNGIEKSSAGNLECHVGTAFASLGDEGDPDVLAVAGEMSSGQVVSIGLWPTTRRLEDISRTDTMSFEKVQLLTNWASATDLVHLEKSHSSRNKFNGNGNGNILVTSGRQPFGYITELRTGFEARVSLHIPEESFRTATDVWALPNGSMGSIVLVLSMPLSSMLLEVASDLSDARAIDDASAFDVTQRTICAGMTANSQLVQVTSQGISASASLTANFEDTTKRTLNENDSILSASLVVEGSVLVTAERHTTGFRICCYSLPSLSEGDTTIDLQCATSIGNEPLCLAATVYENNVIVLTATDHGTVVTVLFDSTTKNASMFERPLSSSVDKSALCDSLTILQAANSDTGSASFLAACGLRDGKIVTYLVDATSSSEVHETHVIDFGNSSVKLNQMASDRSSAVAISGSETCLLQWDGTGPQSLQIENIWAVDKENPAFSQGFVTSVTQMPPATYLAYDDAAEALVMISDDCLFVADVEKRKTTVPRQIRVKGTPTRLIYSESLRSLVCASLSTEVRQLPSSRPHLAPEEKRQIWPVIEFFPNKNDTPAFQYEMQPGERVYALLEWSYRQGNDKTYSHVLVGGSYVRPSGTRRGRVTFLQPKSRNWQVTDVVESRRDPFDDEVYALALYDSVSYIASAGDHVYMKRYAVEEKKWADICPPFKLASPGRHITVEADQNGGRLIVISTARNSLVTLRLREVIPAGTANAQFELQPVSMGPRAESLLTHLVLQPSSSPTDQFTLLSTKFGELLGMASPTEPRSQPGQLLFEARLPRSLTRLTKTTPLKRNGQPPTGVIQQHHITASTTDGSLIGIIFLEPHLWRQLSWLQRLIEWSPDLSPHSFSSPLYSHTASASSTKTRALPIGFQGQETDLAILHTDTDKLQDRHIDGDILARVLTGNGIEAINTVLRELATKDDAVGIWIRGHLDQEAGALEDLVEVVRKLDRWL